jgi:hypothetical protein
MYRFSLSMKLFPTQTRPVPTGTMPLLLVLRWITLADNPPSIYIPKNHQHIADIQTNGEETHE